MGTESDTDVVGCIDTAQRHRTRRRAGLTMVYIDVSRCVTEIVTGPFSNSVPRQFLFRDDE